MNTISNNEIKKNKFSLKFNFFDVVVGIVATLLAVALIVINNVVFANDDDLNNKVANVYYDSKLVHSVAFKDIEDDTYEIILKKDQYPLLNADMTILVSKEKGIRVAEEKSPQKICSRQGWVNETEMPVVCLPNSVYVVIKDINEVDFEIGLQ